VNPDPENLKMGDMVEDLDDPVSRKNFRVVIIKPGSVEATNLSDPFKARRQLYTYEEGSKQWKHEELWP
jgi:pyridoxamine 5'-phosphate oxidase